MTWDDKKQKLTDELAAQLSEFFDCYVLVGFAMDGTRVRLQHAMSDKSMDALQQIMEDTIEREFKIWPTVKTVEAEAD